MDPEDLPELPDLDDLDLDLGRGQEDPGPVVPPVEPDPPQRERIPLDDLELPDLPDLPERDWGTPPPVEPEPGRPDPVELPDAADPQLRGPVELDLGDGSLPAAPPSTASEASEPNAAAHPEVDLSLEHDDLLPAPDVAEPTDDATETSDVVEPVQLPADLHDDPLVLSGDNAWLPSALAVAGIATLGLGSVALRRHRTDPVDFAAQLDQLGIDARVEHLDLTGLQELLDEGRPVLLSTDGSAGVDAESVVRLRGIDRAAGHLVVTDDRDAGFHVDVDRFELAWSDSANQVVVAAEGDRGVALVPVTLLTDDLVATA